MNPDIWGRCLWESMHYIAAGYPMKPTLKDKKVYCAFFQNISNVLPCKSCGVSLKKFNKQIPIKRYLKSRKDLLKWTYLIHNKVNKKLKKTIRISWGNVYKKYGLLSYKPKTLKSK